MRRACHHRYRLLLLLLVVGWALPSLAQDVFPQPRMRVASGSYIGNDTAGRTISGLGFRPDFVLVKGHPMGMNDPLPALCTFSSLPAGTSKLLTEDVGLLIGLITGLTDDGFIVGGDVLVNDANHYYHWIAVAGDGRDAAVGSYIGDGQTDRDVTLGFQPDYVLLLPHDAGLAWQRFRDEVDDRCLPFVDAGEAGKRIVRFSATGFVVGSDPDVNTPSVAYSYLALRAGEAVDVGFYAGNSLDDRNITGLGNRPALLLIKRRDGLPAVHAYDDPVTAGWTSYFLAEWPFPDGIQSLGDDRFQVGVSDLVNKYGKEYYWLGVGPTTDVAVDVRTDTPTSSPGREVRFLVTVTGRGPDRADGVQVTDRLPSGLTFAGATTTRGSYDPGSGLWDVGTLEPGRQDTLVLAATVNQGTVGDVLVNQAQLTAVRPADDDPANDTASASVTVPLVDLTVGKEVDRTSASRGDTVTFTVTVGNVGLSGASLIAVADSLPAGLVYAGHVTSQGSYDPVSGQWAVGSLATSEEAILTLRAVVDTLAATVVNTARLTDASPADIATGNDQDSVAVRALAADLVVGKSVDLPAPVPGDTLHYTVTVTDQGPDPAAGVVVQDVLPAGVAFLAATADQGSYDPGTGRWSVGDLAVGAAATLVLAAVVEADATGKQITNTASVAAGWPADPDPGNDTASATIQVGSGNLLHLTLVASDTLPNVGDQVTFTATLENVGTVTAGGIVVRDVLPPGLGFAGAVPSRGTYDQATGNWEVGELSTGSSCVLLLSADVLAGTGATTLADSARVVAVDQADMLPDDDVATAAVRVQGADLILHKSVDDPAPTTGETVTFTITLANRGPDPATGTTVRDSLPAGLVFSGATASTGSYDPLWGTWDIGTLDPGETATLDLEALVMLDLSGGGEAVNTAFVATVDQEDPAGGDESDQAVLTLQSADVTVSQALSVTAADEGDTVVARIGLSNAGPRDATGMVVSEALDAGLRYLSASVPVDTTGGSVVWRPATLPVGAVDSLAVTLLVEAGTAGRTLGATARLDSLDQADPDGSDNAATAELTVRSCDLSLDAAVDDPAPTVGDTVTFTIDLANGGPDAATAPRVQVVLPAGLVHLSAAPGAGSYDPGTGLWLPGDLAAQQAVTLVLAAEVAAGTIGQALTTTATAAVDVPPDTVPGNDTAAVAVTVRGADLDLAAGVNVTTPNAGETVITTLTVTNLGPDPAAGVVVRDTLPAGLLYTGHSPAAADYDPATGLWTVGGVAVGQSVSLLVSAVVDTGTAGRDLVQQPAVVAADPADPDGEWPAAAVTVHVPAVDLSLTKTVSPATPAAGDTVVFDVAVANAGPDAATGIVVLDVLPAGLVFAGADRPDYDAQLGRWFLGDLAAAAAETLRLRAAVAPDAAGDTLLNTAGIVSVDQADVDAGDDSDSAAVVVGPEADLAVSLRASEHRPNQGSRVTWYLLVTNQGPNPATGIVVADTLPAGVSLDPADVDASQGAYDPATGTWQVGDLAPGEVADLSLGSSVDQGTFGQTLTALVRVVAVDQRDPVAGNDTAVDSLVVQSADLQLATFLDVSSPNEGDVVNITLYVTDQGPDPATGVGVRLRLPDGLTYRGHTPESEEFAAAPDGDGLLWNVGQAAVGAPRVLFVRTTVDVGTTGSTQVVTALIAAADQGDPVPGNDTAADTLVVGGVDLAVAATVDPTVADEGDTVRFHLAVTNLGPNAGSGIAVTDSLPGGLLWLASDPAAAFDPQTGTWQIGDLPPDSTATLELTARVGERTGGSTLTSTIGISRLDQVDPVAANDTIRVGVEVRVPDVGHVLVRGRESGADRLLPGAAPVPMLAWELVNWSVVVDTLRAVAVTAADSGSGDRAQRDAGWTSLVLQSRQGDASDHWRDLGETALADGRAVFDGLSLALAPEETLALRVLGAPSLSARDGDRLALVLADFTALAFGRDVMLDPDRPWPLSTTAAPVVDGMSAAQVTLHPVPAGVVAPGQAAVPVLDVTLPADGYAPDVLQEISLFNAGTARAGEDITALRAWLDDGDGEPGSPADTLLGDLVATGERWILSGLSVTLPVGGRRLLVTADVAATATTDRTLRFGLPGPPVLAVAVAGGNDGLVDGPVVNPTAQLISERDRIFLAAAARPVVTARPGDRDVPLWHLTATNTTADPQQLTSLTLHDATVVAAPHAPGTDLERLTLWADDGDGLFQGAGTDTLLGVAWWEDGQAAWRGLHWSIPAQQTGHLFAAGDLSLTGAADGDTVAVRLQDATDVAFAAPVAYVADWPLGGTAVVVDGLVAAQLAAAAPPSRTVAPGDSLLPLLALRAPGNGGAGDRLLALRLEPAGTATADDLAALRLWRDGGDGLPDGGAGDDSLLAVMARGGDTWEASPAVPVPPDGLLLHVTADVAAGAADGGTLRLRVPRFGLEMASGNDGPIDVQLTGGTELLVSSSVLQVRWLWDASPAAVGDTLTARLEVHLAGDEAVTGIVPSVPEVVGGEATLVSGPAPASLELSPGGTAAFAWRLVATAADTLRLRGRAEGTSAADGRPVASAAVTSDPLPVLQPAVSVAATPTSLLPAMVSAGSGDVPALLWVLRAAGDAATAPPRLEAVTLRCLDGEGDDQAADCVLAQVSLRSGTTVLGKTTIAAGAGAVVTVPLDAPLPLPPGDDVALQVQLELLEQPAATWLCLGIDAGGWLAVTDGAGGRPVPVQVVADSLPVLTSPARIVTAPTGLTVAAAGETLSATRGQPDAVVGRLSFTLQGGDAAAAAVAGGLALAAVTDDGRFVPPGRLLRRLVVEAADGTLVETEPALDDTLLELTFASPLVVTDAGGTCTLRGDLRDDAPAGLHRLVLPGPEGLPATDRLTGQALDVTLAGGVPLGQRVRIQTAPERAEVAALPDEPWRSTLGARGVTVLRLALRHAGDALAAAVSLDSLSVGVLDAAGQPVPADRYLERVAVSVDGSPAGSGGAGKATGGLIVVPIAGVRLDPLQEAIVVVTADISHAAPPGQVTVVADVGDLRLADVNTGQAVPVTPAPGSPTPLRSADLVLVSPADHLAVGGEDRMPPVLAAGATDVPVLRLNVTNVADEGSGDLWLSGLRLAGEDRDGVPLQVGRAIAAARLVSVDSSWSAATALVGSDSLLVLETPQPLVLVPGQTRELELRLDLVPEPPVGSLCLVLDDDGVLVAQADSVGGRVTILPGSGTALPLRTAPATFTRLDLEASYSNFPNPFAAGREATTFVFGLPRPGTVSLVLYTPRGEIVRRLLDGVHRQAGLYQQDRWDGRNGRGAAVRNGVYLAEIRVRYDDGGTERLVRKVAVVR